MNRGCDLKRLRLCTTQRKFAGKLLVGLRCLVEIAKHLLGKPCACEWLYMFPPLGFAKLEHKDGDCYPISSSHTLLPIALGGLVTMESTICSLPAGMWLSLLGWELGKEGSLCCVRLSAMDWVNGRLELARWRNKWREFCFNHLWLLAKRNKSSF